MTTRASFLIAAAVAGALAAALPAWAAMPVGATHAGSDVTLVQAPAATPDAAQKTAAPKSKKSRRQKEVDSSVESGTVPKRYQSSVPKEYHHLIPFAK